MVYGGDDYNVSLSPNLWIMTFDLDLDLDLGLIILRFTGFTNIHYFFLYYVKIEIWIIYS